MTVLAEFRSGFTVSLKHFGGFTVFGTLLRPPPRPTSQKLWVSTAENFVFHTNCVMFLDTALESAGSGCLAKLRTERCLDR